MGGVRAILNIEMICIIANYETSLERFFSPWLF
ncbi:hypothetical protein HNR53_000731 [Bacillus benzoevorans]|uniref:Uncharacterized protein n=1 Tax=Bacillus benzoevorans TaxID=1456 RepID=A0A7X0HNU9_9BACI|nr:hypothetical protein [Bacillus benzoevorans]